MNWRRFLFEKETLRLMSITVLMKPLGLVSQMLIAAYYGASASYDAYNLAFFLVTFVAMTLGRVFSTVAIPQITRIKNSNSAEPPLAYQNSVILLFFFPILFVLLGLAFKGNLAVDIVGKGLPLETKITAYKMVKIMAWPAILMAIVNVTRPVLNLNNHFRFPAFLPLVNTACVIICILFFHDSLGIWAMPLGFALSNLSQAPLLVWRTIKTGSLSFCRPQLFPGSLRTLGHITWMVLLAESMMMVNSFVDKWFAAGLQVGSISAIAYSMTILNFGVQIFSMSLIVVMFTKMSEFFAVDDIKGCNNYIHNNLLKVVNLVVPASLILIVASHEIIDILFKRGAFDSAASLQTSKTMSMYMIGLPALVINGMVARIFHSFQKLKDKVWLGVQFVGTNVIGNAILVKSFGTMGLAISSSIAINLHLILSLIILRSYKTGLDIGLYFRIILRAYLMAGLAHFVAHFLGIYSWIGLFQGSSMPIINSFIIAFGKFLIIILLFGAQIGVYFLLKKKRRSRQIPKY